MTKDKLNDALQNYECDGQMDFTTVLHLLGNRYSLLYISRNSRTGEIEKYLDCVAENLQKATLSCTPVKGHVIYDNMEHTYFYPLRKTRYTENTLNSIEF